MHKNPLEVQEEILNKANQMVLTTERATDYIFKLDFSYYDQITRRNKQYPLQKKMGYKYGTLAMNLDFDGVILSNDATYAEPL